MMPMSSSIEPLRLADRARLALTKLRIEDGVRLDTVYQRVCEAAADVLNVERVGIWLIVGKREALRCVNLFERSKAEHSAGITVRLEDFPDFFETLERRKTLPAEMAQADPRTTSLSERYLEPLGITSLLAAPIFIGGEIIGVIGNEHIGEPREWSTEERDFAGSMADLIALKTRAAEMADAKAALQTRTEQVADLRRLESLATMAAGVAHDFNNILTSIVGLSGMIEMDGSASPEVVLFAKQIGDAVVRGAALVRDLMAFARPGPKSARVIRPSEILVQQLPHLKAAAGEHFPVLLEIRSTQGRVLIALDQIERVVMNLVINARDASPEGSEIRITVDVVDDKFENELPGRFVRIEVTDQGTGIPSNVLPNIFDPFFTTKARGQGTGLGLAVVNQIVTHAGGFIRIQTAENKGTTFQVFLPRVSSQG